MRTGGKAWLRRLLPLLLACCLLLPACVFAEEESFLPLKAESRSEHVRELKKRLQELGYLGSASVTKSYTEKTAEAVADFQRLNGLEPTGEVDQATWDRLFDDGAVKAPRPTMTPLATPAPLPEPDWPARDAEGYLAEDGEYFYENDEQGLWCYLSRNLRITIVRRQDSSIPLEWFETEIWTRNGETFRVVTTDPEHPGRKFR